MAGLLVKPAGWTAVNTAAGYDESSHDLMVVRLKGRVISIPHVRWLSVLAKALPREQPFPEGASDLAQDDRLAGVRWLLRAWPQMKDGPTQCLERRGAGGECAGDPVLPFELDQPGIHPKSLIPGGQAFWEWWQVPFGDEPGGVGRLEELAAKVLV